MYKYTLILSSLLLPISNIQAAEPEQCSEAFSQLKESEQRRRERQELEREKAENKRLQEEALQREENKKREKLERRLTEAALKQKVRDLEKRVAEQDQAIKNMQSGYVPNNQPEQPRSSRPSTTPPMSSGQYNFPPITQNLPPIGQAPNTTSSSTSTQGN